MKKPVAQVYPVVKEVLVGEDFNFSCYAPGNNLSFQWLKNGRRIPNNQTFRKASKTVKGVTFSENLLLIKVATKQHDANYICDVMTPSDPSYSSKATASLLVKGMIGFTSEKNLNFQHQRAALSGIIASLVVRKKVSELNGQQTQLTHYMRCEGVALSVGQISGM